MAVKVIVELQAKPGQRDELRRRIEALAAAPGSREAGYLGSDFHEIVGEPDSLVDIATWESPEARTAHLQAAMAAGDYGPVLELVAAPFRATVIRPLS